MPVSPQLGKFGSASAWLLVDGYALSVAKLQGLRCKIENLQEPTHGIGDSWEESTPVGVSKAEFGQDAAFFDTTSGSIHDAILAATPGGLVPTSAPRIACLGFSGVAAAGAIGQPFIGIQGAFNQEYELIAEREKLQKANVAYTVDGKAEYGDILHNYQAETANGNTQTNSVDNSAAVGATVHPITSSATNDEITCPTPHGLTAGDTVIITGHTGSTPSLNGEQTVLSITSPTIFKIVTDITVGGTGGTFTRGKSNNGGAAYLQVNALTLGGYTNVTMVVRHSADNSVWADLQAFVATTAAKTAQRIAVAGAVNRYLACNWTLGGAGSGPSFTFMCGFARS